MGYSKLSSDFCFAVPMVYVKNFRRIMTRLIKTRQFHICPVAFATSDDCSLNLLSTAYKNSR